MTKISWNDINDADSSLSSDAEQSQKTPPKLVQKVTTESTNETKLKNACDKFSLTKLQNHGKGDVWLFVPNSFHEQADKVHEIIENCSKLNRVIRIKAVGWNAVANFQNASKLIHEGLVKDNLLIRFIYSNKNQQKSSHFDEKPKMEKKITYVEKGSKIQMEKSSSMIDQTSKNDVNNRRDEKGYGSRQRPKYREKDNSSRYGQNKQQINSERIRSPQNYHQAIKTIKSPKKYVEKSKIEPPNALRSVQSAIVQQKILEEKEEKQTSELPLKKHQTYNEGMELEERGIQKNIYDDSDHSSSSESIEQKKKKKHKKKKNKSSKPEKKDSNNPFSYFSQ